MSAEGDPALDKLICTLMRDVFHVGSDAHNREIVRKKQDTSNRTKEL